MSEEERVEEEEAPVQDGPEPATPESPAAAKPSRLDVMGQDPVRYISKEPTFLDQLFDTARIVRRKWHYKGWNPRRHWARIEVEEEWIGLLYDLTGQVPQNRFTEELTKTDTFVRNIARLGPSLRLRHLRAYISQLFFRTGLGLRTQKEPMPYDVDFSAARLRYEKAVEAGKAQRAILEETVRR